jgi:hypothetical protein
MLSLVKRLRNHKHNESLNKADLEKLCKEAADRIDELEKHYNTQVKEVERLKKIVLDGKRKNVTLKNQNSKHVMSMRLTNNGA